MAKKKIKVSDILGDNYYVYELTSSNYTPALNGTITITCTMKDVYGTAASGKSITLYQNGTSKGAQTTNSSGVATWSITCSTAGIQSFKVGNKAIEVFVDNKSDNTHTHTIDLNSFNFYDADNWRTIDGDTPTITSDSIQANAVSHHILNKEFLESKHYTLTFEFNIGSNRGGFYLFGDKDCNMLFEITTDIRNTCILQHDSNGNTTELYAGTKNHFTSGWHDIKVIRKGDTAIVYIDDELYYTFNNIGNATNIFGLLKWSSGSATIKNIDVSLDITELPIEDYIKKDPLKTIEGVNLVGNEDIAIEMRKNSNIIFEDKGSPNRISNYGTMPHMESNTNPSFTISYDHDEQAYLFAGECCITPLTGITDDFKLEVDMKRTVNSEWCGLSFVQNIGNGFFYGGCNGYWQGHYYQNNSWRNSISGGGTSSVDTWYHLELKKEGTTITINTYDIDRVIKLRSTSRTYDDSDNYYGIILTGYFKNVKAEYLNNNSLIDLSTDKTILSFYDNESATLTTTYKAGAIIDLYDADTMTRIGNFTEDNGTYTYNYASTGKGNINLVAKVGSQISEPICIEDCLFYGINTDAFDIPEDTTFTSDTDKITATTSTSGEKLVYFNHDFQQNDNFLFESEVAEMGVYQVIGMNWNDVNYYGGQYGGTNRAYVHLTSSDAQISHTFAVGDKYTVIRKDETTSAYINNDLISSASCSYNTTFKVGFFINQDRTQYYKNIKIKIMNDVIPYAPQLKNTIYLKEEDITIDVSCGRDPTVIFEDACSSASGLSNYGSSECIRGSNAIMRMEYDRTENAYKVYGNGNYHCYMPITALNGETQYKISADVKGQAIKYNMIGFYIDNSADTTSYGLSVGLDIGKTNDTYQRLWGRLFKVSSDGTEYQVNLANNTLSTDKYYNLRLEVNDNSYTWSLYDGTTKIAENNLTYTINNKKIGIFLFCETGTTNSVCYIKNIKAETLNNDLTTYLLDTSNYEFITGDSTKLSIENDNELKGTSSLICLNNNTFTNSNSYTLSLEWKLSSGYDGGLVIGDSNNWISITQQTNQFAIQHGTGTNDNVNPRYDTIPSSHRYNSYVPVIIIRDGYDWTLDVNNGEITSSWTTTVDHPNRLGIRTRSPTCYVRNLQLQSNRNDGSTASKKIIHLGDDIITMIETALGHMITNWEDYE